MIDSSSSGSGSDEFLFRDDIGEWCIRLEKKSDRLTRGASLRSFLAAGVPGVTADLVESAIAILEAGIYADDVAAQEGLQLEVVKETAGVRLEVHDGVPCRIFVPQ